MWDVHSFPSLCRCRCCCLSFCLSSRRDLLSPLPLLVLRPPQTLGCPILRAPDRPMVGEPQRIEPQAVAFACSPQPAPKPGAPYLGFEMWASCEARPLSSTNPNPRVLHPSRFCEGWDINRSNHGPLSTQPPNFGCPIQSRPVRRTLGTNTPKPTYIEAQQKNAQADQAPPRSLTTRPEAHNHKPKFMNILQPQTPLNKTF
jgi:hypothetical protein